MIFTVEMRCTTSTIGIGRHTILLCNCILRTPACMHLTREQIALIFDELHTQFKVFHIKIEQEMQKVCPCTLHQSLSPAKIEKQSCIQDNRVEIT